jgi:hypothetical protein
MKKEHKCELCRRYFRFLSKIQQKQERVAKGKQALQTTNIRTLFKV